MRVREGLRQALQSAVQTVAVGAITTVERLRTGVAFNPLERGFLDDPYPQYKKLQSKDPVHRSRLVNGWVLTRYADCVRVLTDDRFFTDDRKLPTYDEQRRNLIEAGAVPADDPDTPVMLRLDPPDHTRLRSLVNKAFTPRTIEQLRPRIEEIVHELLEAAAGGGSMDVIEDIAYPLPVIVIAELLGVPAEDREQLRRWSDDIVSTLGIQTVEQARRASAAGREMNAYLERIGKERKREPRDDLLSTLVAAEEEGDKLTMEEVYSLVLLILIAGHETTTNLIGNGLLALLRNPDQLELLRDDPTLAPGAVEELLRYDSPVQATARFAIEEIALDGRTVKPYQQLVLALAAANRDPEQFAEPDRLDITREEGAPLSFSHGIHFCLGAPLARIEGEIAIPAILRRFPDLKLAGGKLEWRDAIILRGLKALPVVFSP